MPPSFFKSKWIHFEFYSAWGICTWRDGIISSKCLYDNAKGCLFLIAAWLPPNNITGGMFSFQQPAAQMLYCPRSGSAWVRDNVKTTERTKRHLYNQCKTIADDRRDPTFCVSTQPSITSGMRESAGSGQVQVPSSSSKREELTCGVPPHTVWVPSKTAG